MDILVWLLRGYAYVDIDMLMWSEFFVKKFWLLILMLAIMDIDIGVYLELILYNVYNVSRGFLNFQRKLCPNFQVLIMHMFRGSFKVKTDLSLIF